MKTAIFLTVIASALSVHAQLTPIKYADGKQQLSGFYAKPEKKSNNAGVLILPAWMGVDEHSKESAKKLAALGYHAFVADIYGEGNKPKDASEAGQRAGHYKTNYKEYQHRINLALQQLIKSGADPNKIAVIGYCFGGTGALEAARGNLPVLGVVSFHGGLGRSGDRPVDAIKAKILVCHGADDPYVPKSEIESFEKEMKESKADWQMIYYADAVHAFTEPQAGNDKSRGAAYNEAAARRSWAHMELFFNELFK